MEGQPKRIELALKAGDAVLVQVTKDPMGHKGTSTSQISLPGRFLVYVPEGGMTGISRKLPDKERSRLKRILRSVMPEEAGVIVRTAAEGRAKNNSATTSFGWQSNGKIRRGEDRFGAQPTACRAGPGDQGGPRHIQRDFAGMIVSGDEAYAEVHEYITRVAPDTADRLQKWTKNEDVFSAFASMSSCPKALIARCGYRRAVRS